MSLTLTGNLIPVRKTSLWRPVAGPALLEAEGGKAGAGTVGDRPGERQHRERRVRWMELAGQAVLQ